MYMHMYMHANAGVILYFFQKKPRAKHTKLKILTLVILDS